MARTTRTAPPNLDEPEQAAAARKKRRPPLPLHPDFPGPSPIAQDYLLASQLQEALDALRLNPLERAVAEMRLTGATVREIAASSGIKKWRIEGAMAAIRRRWLEARQGPERPSPVRRAAGWQDVYMAEMRRRGKP